jgi:hypothetical protein
MRIQWWKWRRTVISFVVLASVLLVGAVLVTAQDQEKSYPELDQQLQLLKNQFNADAGKVRLLLIGDPTCPPCRHGVSVIRENVLEKFATDKLVAYVVWVPLLNLQDPARLQKNAHRHGSLLSPGPRVTHYSDPEAYLGKKYGPMLGVPYGSPAWDVYFAFGADVRWGETPPIPSYWEHQLGGLGTNRLLDGPHFAEEVRKLLAKVGQ